MKRFALICLFGFALAACSHKDDNSSPGTSTIPGMPSGTLTHYQGTVQNLSCTVSICTQQVTVNSDPINHPGDSVIVYLCRNMTCVSPNQLPSVTCTNALASLPQNTALTTPCYDTIPSPHIILGTNLVGIVNANEPSYWDANKAFLQLPGYSSYAIDTIINR